MRKATVTKAFRSSWKIAPARQPAPTWADIPRSHLDLGRPGATIVMRLGPSPAMTTPTPPLATARLDLMPMSVAIVEAVMRGRRDDAERLVGARMPERWPNRELIERAFTASLEAITADPEVRLWGDRVMIVRQTPDEPGPRVVGSVVFHGLPGDDGLAEIAYGVEEASQGQGYATEAVAASLEWALGHARVRAVQAATFGWHRPSIRVIEKVGMVHIGTRDHETMGELLVYERRVG
jgi:ribosomal-protein-alanine N-acetyltransferase